MEVKVRNNNVKVALKIFKRKMQEDGRLHELRERAFYQKKSDKRRRARSSAKVREAKRQSEGALVREPWKGRSSD